MTKLEEIAAILRGPGAMCLMSERETAREILEALRKPTPDMIDAAEQLRPPYDHEVGSVTAEWQAMIDAALGVPHGTESSS